jgi:hypothetical protein
MPVPTAPRRAKRGGAAPHPQSAKRGNTSVHHTPCQHAVIAFARRDQPGQGRLLDQKCVPHCHLARQHVATCGDPGDPPGRAIPPGPSGAAPNAIRCNRTTP